MFKLNPTLRTVEAGEQDVVDLYRSVSEATDLPAGMKDLPSEGFICGVREDDGVAVYIALLESSTKKAFIYTDPEGHCGDDSYDDAVAEAVNFMESFGLKMECINLNYSRALREVIVRSVRVISPPGEARKPSYGKGAPVRRGGVGTPAIRSMETAGKESSDSGGVDAVTAPGKALTEKKEGGKAGKGGGGGEDSDYEREKPLPEKAKAEKLASAEAETARHALNKAEVERAERQKLLLEKAESEKRADEQAESARLLRAKVDAERLECERLLAEKAAADLSASHQAEADQHALNKLEVERRERERLLAAIAEIDQQEALLVEAARLNLEKAEADRAESERIIKEYRTVEAAAAASMEESRQKLDKAESERSETEKILVQKAVAEQRAVELIDAARVAWEIAEAERVEYEQMLLSNIAAEKLAEEQAEESRLALEQAVELRAEREKKLAGQIIAETNAYEQFKQTQGAWDNAEAERLENEPVCTEEAGAEGARSERSGEVSLTLEQAVNEHTGWAKNEGSAVLRRESDMVKPESDLKSIPMPTKVPGPDASDSSPFSNPFQCDQGISFSIDRSLTAINLDKGGVIRELYSSSNMARVTMENFPAQNCTAFLFVIENGSTFAVYVSFMLAESCKVLVYLPDRQPEAYEECHEIVREGIGFIETVGLIMDRVDLGTEGQAKAFERLPALRRVVSFA